MATLHSRSGGVRRSRWRRVLVLPAVVAALAGSAWFAPGLIALSSLRDRPLATLFAGIDGRVTSRAAAWRWWGGIEYRDVALVDRDGRPLVAIPRVIVDRGLAALLLDPADLGPVRLVGAEALLEVRRGGSTLEDVLAPWLAALAQGSAPAVSFELEVVDAAVELVDLERDDAWRITDILAAGTVRADATLAGWTVSGRTRHSGSPVRDLAAAANRLASDGAGRSAGPAGAVPRIAGPGRLDRTTVAAGATATLARDGGWSVSSPDVAAADAPRSLAVAATRLPLGVSGVAATRFDARHLLDGLADLRLDITLPPAGAAIQPEGTRPPGVRPAAAVRVSGVISGTQLAVRRSESREPLVAVDRAEMPLDVVIEGGRVGIRALRVSSQLFQAEATGRIRLPTGSAWDWAELQIGEDFALAADIDLAAAARMLPGGLAVRPDVRVTQGELHLTAAARNDGHDRVLEIRATSRDLAAVQGVVAAGGGRQERQLRWTEPFTAWLRGRRGLARGERMRIEEARVASSAVEVSAAGDAQAAVVQWTIDLASIVGEAAEVLELDGIDVAGVARGRLDIDGAAAGDARARLSASLSDFVLARPGRQVWRDAELSLEAEGAGSLSENALLVDRGRAIVSAAGDALELTLTGGVLVNLTPLLGGRAGGAGGWLHTVPGGQPIAADIIVAGDAGRWQSRWGGLTGAGGEPTIGGSLKASAALAADADGWRITRAGGEVEKLKIQLDGRQIVEPRAVASAAGRWQPATGLVEISSAEVLTATASLRTGGLTILPRPRDGGAVDTLVDRVRGKVQWQADVGRLEGWLAPSAVAARWPATGRGFGTVEILDTPLGLNLLVEATGSGLAVAGRPAGAAGPDARPSPLWNEPRASIVLEVTRPRDPSQPQGEELVINQLKLESSTLAVSAAGSVRDWSTRRLVDIGGNVAYDWEQVTRLVTPWTGGRVRLAGNGARPFVLRGPLGGTAVVAATDDAPAHRVPLPDEWLAATGGAPGTFARLTLPAPATPSRDAFAARLAAMSFETSAAWTGADVAGFPVDPGEMPVRLFEGQLALGPFDLGVAGGRLRGSPWLRLVPLPGEVVVPPGRCVDRVMLSRELSDRWVRWLVPLVGHAARMQGWMSVDLAGARVPLADPFGGEASGQVIFENLEAVPGGDVQPLVNLLAKLQTAIDPRFAFGDKVVLLRVRPDPVRVQLADRRLWHDGLVIDSGQLVLRSAGSVAADGALAMNVEVSFRGDIAGATPVVGKLLRTPLLIPLRGTVDRPQFDARALDTIVARIVENTADAVINDGLGRSLEALFGNPPPASPPPAPPPPLTAPGAVAAPVASPAPAAAPLTFPAPAR